MHRQAGAYRVELARWHLAALRAGLALAVPLLFLAGFVTGRDMVPRPALRHAGVALAAPAAAAPAQDAQWPEIAAALARIRGLAELRSHALPAKPETAYRDLIDRVARQHAVNPELVAAVVRVESAFDPWAVSGRGARGLMQVLPATARRFEVDAARLHDPEQNLLAGVRYLSWLDQRFDGDLQRVLAAYNAGEAAVEEHGGMPPFPETRDYVRRVIAVLDRDAFTQDSP